MNQMVMMLVMNGLDEKLKCEVGKEAVIKKKEGISVELGVY